jgi:hypothetical protein
VNKIKAKIETGKEIGLKVHADKTDYKTYLFCLHIASAVFAADDSLHIYSNCPNRMSVPLPRAKQIITNQTFVL